MFKMTLAEADRRVQAMLDKKLEEYTEGDDGPEDDGVDWREVERAERILDEREKPCEKDLV